MMKKMVSMAMAAVMAATLMVAVAPAEVNAEERNTDVTFENTSTSEVVTAEYTVTIPKAIKFTTENKSIAADVAIAPTTSGADLKQIKVKIDVKSTGGYKLTNADGDTLEYSLTYATTMTGTTNNAVGVLEKTNATITGTALLTDANAATKSGTYSDTLTYTITKTHNADGTTVSGS